MIDKIIGLRNRVHKNDFRFVLTPEHWNVLYVPEGVEKHNLAAVTKNGELKGYAAYYLINFEEARAYDVREICAEDEKILAQLLDQIADRSVKDSVDFVFIRKREDPYRDMYAKRGFLSFLESVIMIALLNPRELLSALSEEIEKGKVLKLLIEGFDPITVKVGEKGIIVVKENRSDLTVSTNSETFLRLFFGRTSFLKEFLKRRVTLNNILNWTTANRFFNLIKQDNWHIPMGDWA